MAKSNHDVVRMHFEEMWNKQNYDLADEIMADDYIEHAAEPFRTAEPGNVNGPEKMRETMKWLIAQFPDIKMTVEAVVSEGDIVVARVLSEGTNLGRLGGRGPATGKKFSARQSHWYRVRGGKLAEHWATRDDLTAMIQLGAVKVPGPPAPVRLIQKVVSSLKSKS